MRSCDNPLCTFVDRTYEILDTGGTEVFIDQLFDLVRRVAENVDGKRVKDKLCALHKEIGGMN
ncbi:MAG: hypothetical protein HGJ94_04205 [Desulfosarcina sp.]|nr:hypothetical protein [Desulfosarcina sp.]MBC2743512.1 hypothetical protein [Desulfosarcina sp.]MBC2766422.1 hypothetical protein [Desulfosarcina sp.]